MPSRGDRGSLGVVSIAGMAALALVWALASCSDKVTVTPHTTQATTGGGGMAGAGGGSGGGGGSYDCIVPDDGICDESDCDCFVCSGMAICQPGGCYADGFCALGEVDSCTCSDCDWSPQCVTYGGINCNKDGVCDFASEGCGCSDCWDVATCLDNVGACSGGKPDGVCGYSLGTESCECVDCFGTPECFPCADNGSCPETEPCLCADCAAVCTAMCDDDGLCDWSYEGCQCADCAMLPVCAN